ncbi:MAG: PAS domain-containing protein [Proteobacteria bacterium]|nr:PAS domain-containing protein [Pseudomonadota bacterium]
MDVLSPSPNSDNPGAADGIAGIEVVAEHLSDLVSLVAADGRIQRQFGRAAVSGYDFARRAGRHVLEHVHPEDRVRAQDWLRRLAAGERVGDLALRERHANGDWRHVRARGTNLLATPAIHALLIEERDETEQHAAQASVNVLRDRLRLVAQSMRLGFFEYDCLSKRFEFSDECFTMRGLSPPPAASVLGVDLLTKLHPEDAAPARESLHRVVDGPGDDWDIEFRVRTASGDWMWLQQHARVLERDREGRALRIAGLLLDVDRRKRAERGLVHSEARYRTVVAMTPGFVHESTLSEDGRMRLQWASEGFTRLLGWTVAEFNDRGSWPAVIHPAHRGPAADRRSRAFKGEPAHGETRLLAKNGDWRWFAVSLFPLQEPGTGRVTSAMGMLYDITDRKHAEEQLRASEERFRYSTAALRGVVYERDIGADVVTCSSGVAEVLGFTEEQRVSSYAFWRERIHPDDRDRVESDRLQASSGGLVTAEYRVRHADGHYVDVLDRAIVVRDESGHALRVVGCAIDISDVRAAQRLLHEAETLARVGSWQFEVATGKLTYSDEAIRIAGIAHKDAPHDLRALYRSLAPESALALRAAVERALSAGEPYQLDIEIVRRDGSRCWLRTSGRAELVDGRPVRLYGALQDIDALKRGELKLREQGERLRLAIDAGQLAAWRWDPRSDHFIIEYRSDSFDTQAVFRETLEDEITTIEPDHRARFRRMMHLTASTGQPGECEFAALTPGGPRRWFRVRVIRAMTPQGPVVIGTSFNTTAVRQREDAQRASEALLRSVTDNSPDFITVVDPELRIRFANRTLQGTPPEALLGRPAVEQAAHPEEFEARLRSVLAHGRALRFESQGVREDGSDGVFEYRMGALREGGQVTAVIVCSTDITERRALEREILEISAREQRRIGSDLHDGLGQELTGLALLLDGLARDVRRGRAPRDAELRELTALARGAIEQTRTLARGLSPVALDGGGLVHALRALAARAREMYGLDVRFRSRVTPRVTLDAAATGHLYRIAQESLTNAARHAGARTVTVQLTVRDRRVQLAVSDDGRGLAPGSTTGVGLKIMRYRANMLGGELQIGPGAEGRGTRIACLVMQPEPTPLEAPRAAGDHG